MILLIVTTLLILVTELQACVYSQSHWLSKASEPWEISSERSLLNRPLCGVSWHTLMHLNTSQVRDTGATYWLLAFHQLCTAVLNMQHSITTSPSSPLPSSIELSITVLFDSMQRYCTNMSGWVLESKQDVVLATQLRDIMHYNHVGEPCDPISALPFSFTQSPQLFFLGYNETEQNEAKRQAEVIKHIYKIQTLLVIFSSFAAFLVIPLLVMYVVMLKNKRREYLCCRDTAEEASYYDVGGPEEFIMIQENDKEYSDSDRSPRFIKEKAH